MTSSGGCSGSGSSGGSGYVQLLLAEIDKLKAENERLKSSHVVVADDIDVKGVQDFRKSIRLLEKKALTVVVLGASGHLARTKTYPTLFALFVKDLLPSTINIVGVARTKMTDAEFHKTLTKIANAPKAAEFLKICTYFAGQYDSVDSIRELDAFVKKREQGRESNRLFYLAVPPQVFAPATGALHDAGLTRSGWNRLIVEKPFGRDSESSEKLSATIMKYYSEDEIYRIDHYLGKEMVMNLMTLRFANTVYEPVWNRNFISSVMITFKEQDGVEGRGGYFDEFGIIRDVMQNHLLQMMALVAMEPPITLNAEDVRNEKVKVVRSIPELTLDRLRIGQYAADEAKGKPGYRDDPSIPKDSLTPTFASAVLYVNNPRWDGVPFILKCGKGLNERKAEVRIQFKKPPGSLFSWRMARDDLPVGAADMVNELVLRVQPDEAIYLKMCTKTPGLAESLEMSELDLTYRHRFRLTGLPDAYERLILDALRGDHSLFVRGDELAAAWKIFTPVLHQIEQSKLMPELYTFGSRGPASADEMVSEVGVVRSTVYKWTPPHAPAIVQKK